MKSKNFIVSETVPYQEDVSLVFESFSHLPWAVMLDSGRPSSTYGKYDIISAFPKKTFVTYGNETIVSTSGNRQKVLDDPFELLSREVEKNPDYINELPFTGGAIGFFSYDLGRTIERMPEIAEDDMLMPDMAVGIYHWAYIADHENKKSVIVGDISEPRVRLNWQDIKDRLQAVPATRHSPSYSASNEVRSNMTKQEYKEKFTAIKNYIGAGDCYQVNLAQRFTSHVKGSPWDGYKKLRAINPSPFSAFINIPGFSVLSASPERFLQVRKNMVETRPIKGTRPRSSNPDEDKKLQIELSASVKDRAENVMIVDLLRNDLSKCCVSNSVKVPGLFEIESFPTVHHLVSTITGRLSESGNPLQLLRACFPGGSITGAPKIRAMEIIEELEPHRRALYCGSIAYLGFNGDMDSNIAIRTLIQKNQQVYFYAGGGLVWDSDADDEYQETFDKAAAMFKLLA